VKGACFNKGDLCIEAVPASVAFGPVKVGDFAALPLALANCGKAPLEISGISMQGGSSPMFAPDLSLLDHLPSADNPLVVPPGEAAAVNLMFLPDAISAVDAQGNPIPEKAVLVAPNNTAMDPIEVPLSGIGIDPKCPIPVVSCVDGNEVVPQTVVHLSAKGSSVKGGTIAGWEWEVTQPDGSHSALLPSDSVQEPTFLVPFAGEYTFTLNVFDAGGKKSCFPASYKLAVVPDTVVHVELLWKTPGDEDETDTFGADLDLHFVHPFAGGPDIDKDGKPDGWFAAIFDCFWYNPDPDWGLNNPGIDDDPHLFEDPDGAGPELLDFGPSENVVYKIGAHYWSDPGVGASSATVRVYIYGKLVFEKADVLLVEKDMWDIASVSWPDAKVVPVDKITPAYVNPYFDP